MRVSAPQRRRVISISDCDHFCFPETDKYSGMRALRAEPREMALALPVLTGDQPGPGISSVLRSAMCVMWEGASVFTPIAHLLIHSTDMALIARNYDNNIANNKCGPGVRDVGRDTECDGSWHHVTHLNPDPDAGDVTQHRMRLLTSPRASDHVWGPGLGWPAARQREALIIKTDGSPSHLPHVIILAVSVRTRVYCANMRRNGRNMTWSDGRYAGVRIYCLWEMKGGRMMTTCRFLWLLSPENVIMWSLGHQAPALPSSGHLHRRIILSPPGCWHRAPIIMHYLHIRTISNKIALYSCDSGRQCGQLWPKKTRLKDAQIIWYMAIMWLWRLEWRMESLKYCLSRREGQIGSIFSVRVALVNCIYWTLYSDNLHHWEKRYKMFASI